MKNNTLEPQLDLNKTPILKLIDTYLSKHNPDELFEHMLNTLMKSERSTSLAEHSHPDNKGNGYRPIQGLGMHRKLKLLIPRDRLSLFKPLIIGILNNQEQKIRALTYHLYGKGLTSRQIGPILEDIYGENYSKSTISRINKTFHHNIKKGLNRRLDPTYPIVMIDAIHIKVKRDTVATEAFYIVLGVNKHFKRAIIAVINHPTESASGWQEVLKSLKNSGLKKVRLFVSDDLTGLDASISKEFPQSDHQQCTLHLKRNLANKGRKKYRKECLSTLTHVLDPEASFGTKGAVRRFKRILGCQSDHFPSLLHTIQRDDLELYFTYLKYDKRIRRMIYTTHWIERFNKSVRRTTKIRDSLPSPHSALMLIGYVAMEGETQTYNY